MRNMRLPWVSVIGLLCVLLVSLIVAGCGPRAKEFTDEEFKKVDKGMDEAKVLEILGAPFDTAEAPGLKRLWWKVGEKYYTASFKDGKVEVAEGPGDKQHYESAKALMIMLKGAGK
jgi:hypothetical protein